MSDAQYDVVVTSGDLRLEEDEIVAFQHRWTRGGVVVKTEFTGAHLLHLAIAGCVLNDVHREAERLGIDVAGVRVSAWGRFDEATWQSGGVDYAVEVSSQAAPEEVEALLRIVDEVAEIPKALRQGARVRRVPPRDVV